MINIQYNILANIDDRDREFQTAISISFQGGACWANQIQSRCEERRFQER